MCDFSVFLQVCITGVNRTLFLWVLNVPVQILRVALNMFCLFCFKKPILVTMSREATTDYLNNILSVKKLKFL